MRQFPASWLPRRRRRDDVIDLSDASAEACDPLTVDSGNRDELDDIAATGGAPGAAPDAAAADPEPAGTDEAPSEPSQSVSGRLRSRLPRHRLDRLLGFAMLSRRTVASLPSVASTVMAASWLLATVLLGTVLTTVAVGMVADRSLIDPTTLVGVWRLAHGMPVATADGAVALVPMLPGILVCALVVRASSWLWSSLEGLGDGRPLRQAGLTPLVGTALLGGAYTVGAILIATSPTAASVSAQQTLTQGWASLVGVVLLGLAITAARRAVRPRSPRLWLVLRASVSVLGILLALSFVTLLVRLVLSWSQFQEMANALLASGGEPASRLDAVALGALQLAYLPNLVVWIAAYLVGAGFAVGSDTIVSPFSVTVGTLPEVPLASLMPEQALRWPWLPLVLVALASVLAGSMLRAARLTHRMRTRVVVGAVVALGSAVGLALLAGFSNGGLGAGRLESMGPSPGITFFWTLMIVGLGQMAWALLPTLIADLVPLGATAQLWFAQVRAQRAGRSALSKPPGKGVLRPLRDRLQVRRTSGGGIRRRRRRRSGASAEASSVETGDAPAPEPTGVGPQQ